MHPLNSKENITRDFYMWPQTSNGKRLEYLYNKIYGTLPTTLTFSDEFEVSVVEKVEANFELLCADINKVGDRLLEEGVWVGKPDSDFRDVFLQVNYGTPDGDLMYIDVGLSSRLGKKDSLKDVFVRIRAVCGDRSVVPSITKLFNNHIVERKSKVYILTSMYGELTFSALPMDPHDTDLALNYGDEFPEFHTKLTNSLNEDKSGLYLFYGAPGTGKSSYIKYLLSGNLNRKIAYIPVGLIDKLVSPDMLPLLMENKDIILLIEDAEKALLSREESENSSLVSTILNLTDGFIGQALNISVIATFNTAKDRIDSALLRKGRLKLSHEFRKLTVDESKKLAKHIGKDAASIDDEMSLADIYHIEKTTGYEEPSEKRVFGFGKS
jgi:hypothetical protein